MSTAPDEKKEAEIEGELSWSGVKIPDHFHLSWFASVMGWGGVALAINGYPGVKQDYGTKAQDRMHDIATVVYQIHTDTEWRFFKVVGRVLAAILTLTACYIHALTIKHAVTPKFWHGFHPKQT